MTKANLRNFDNIQNTYPIYQIASNLKAKLIQMKLFFQPIIFCYFII